MGGNPFDYLNAINSGKNDMIRDSENPEVSEKEYPAFMVNRGLSYHIDAIMYANDTNMWAHMPGIMQNDYLLKAVPRKKRFGKWAKAFKHEDVDMLVKYYGFSRKKAEGALSLHTPEQLDRIRETLDPGGR